MKSIGAASLVVVLSVSALEAQAAWQPEALPSVMPDPADNPSSPAKVHLGNALFFDKRLSSDGTVACSSCHKPSQGGDDNLPVAIGVQGRLGPRNAPTVWNAGLASAQFWDGRAATLEAQAMGPMITPVEMGNANHDEVVAKVKAISGYQPLFDAAFGAGDNIDIDNISKAIGAFERTLLTPNSPFDQYIKGDTSALSADQVAGLALFDSKGCTDCHTGPLLAKQGLQIGQAFTKPFPQRNGDAPDIAQYDLESDVGLEGFTGNPVHRNRWRVPTLRNIELTAPYFHNGSVDTLEEAVRVMAKTQLQEGQPELTTGEINQLSAFLRSLTGELPQITPVVVADDVAEVTPVPLPVAALAALFAGLVGVFGWLRRR